MDRPALLAALVAWPLLSACGVQLAAALSRPLSGSPSRGSGPQPNARPVGFAVYILFTVQLVLGAMLAIAVTVGAQRWLFDAGSLADGATWGFRILLGIDGLSASGILLVSGLGVGWCLGRLRDPSGGHPESPSGTLATARGAAAEAESPHVSPAGTLLAMTLLSGLFLSRDLLLFGSLLFALELPLVLWARLRPSLARLLGAAAFLYGAIRFAELHGRAFGRWSFDYDRLVRMTLGPSLQRPLFLWIVGGISVWALFVLIGLHRRVGERAEPVPNGPFASPHHCLMALLPGVVAYALLRFAVPLFPNAARSYRSEAFAILAVGLTVSMVLALNRTRLERAREGGARAEGARHDLWTHLMFLYAACAAFLVFSFGAQAWRLSLTIAAFFPAAWALDAGLEALGHPARLGRIVCVVSPPVVAAATTYSSLSPASTGLLGLGVVASASSAAAVLGWSFYKSRRDREGLVEDEPSRRPRFGLLFALLVSLTACALVYQAHPALNALEGYTKERISHPPRGLQLRFELVGRETVPTPAIGVDRPLERPGGSGGR